MPLYEYNCPACKKVHEVMQKFADAPLSECPECNGPVTKLMSLNSFSLKGGGWYATDYKRKAASEAAPSVAAPAAPAATAASATPSAPASSTAPAS